MILDVMFSKQDETFNTELTEQNAGMSTDLTGECNTFSNEFSSENDIIPTKLSRNIETFSSEFGEVYTVGGGIMEETDPTVPEWAKQPEKPNYHITEIDGYDEVGGGVGENVEGTFQTPFDPNEAGGFEYIYGEPMEASMGAEIFNSYHGDIDDYGVPDIDRNIAIGFMSQASGFRTQAIGNYSQARGWWTKADGQCSIAEGLLTITSGHFCHAEGTRTQATVNNAHSEGDRSVASGRQSHAEGNQTKASGYCAHAEGNLTEATNYYSHAEGWGTISAGRQQTAMGKYNIKDTSSLLIIGKGSSATARSNALTVNSSGNVSVAGTITSAGADYAEYFEWLDGNPNNEDRVGLIVTLEGEKIRLANDGDDILGVISGTAMVLGDNHEWEWKDKYVTDDYGRIVYDEPIEEFVEYIDYGNVDDTSTWVEVKESTGFQIYPKLNPNYDPTQPYVNRADRQEWGTVGLLGKIHIRDDGSCEVGKYAKIGKDGIATAAEDKTNMRVMKRINDNIIWCLVK